MSAGTVVIAGGILATVILLTIVGVLCLCRLQRRLKQRGSPARNSSPSARSRREQEDTGTRSYYCCKREESEKGEEEEPELATMSPSRPLALSAPPTPPTPEHYGIEPENYPPTFLTEANGPASYSPTPPPRRCQRSHAFCPSCARCSMPFYLQHPERLCNGGRRISYRTVQQQDLELPVDLASFYHKLNLIRSVTMKEVVTHSISTDV